MEKSTIFNGNMTISMAIFNSYVKLPEGMFFLLLYPDIVNLAQRDLVHIGTMVRRVGRRS